MPFLRKYNYNNKLFIIMNNLKSKNNICISGVDIISKYVIQYLKMIYDV